MQVRDIMVMFLSVIGLLHNAKKIMLPWYASAEPLECDDDDLSRSYLRNSILSWCSQFLRCSPLKTNAHETSVQVTDFDLLLGAWKILPSRMYRGY
jgi:hypothetical protein